MEFFHSDWLIDALANTSGTTLFVSVAVLMFMNSSIMVPPSEWIGIGAGLSAALIGESLYAIFAVAAVANFLGTLGWYILGIYQSRRLMQTPLTSKAVSPPQRRFLSYLFYPYVRWLPHIEKALKKRGPLGIFFLRLVPVVRSIASLPAGRIQMAVLPFAAASLLGMGFWSFLWFYWAMPSAKIAYLTFYQ